MTLGQLVEELRDIRLALVQKKSSRKVEIMVEEMNAKQTRLFSFGFGEIYKKLNKSIAIGSMF